MILQTGSLSVHVEIYNNDAKQTMVMLHGFTGSAATWEKIAANLPDHRIIAIDLIGHGKTDSPGNAVHYSMEEQISVLEELFIQLDCLKFTLLGYSMGGRVALSYAAAYPNRIEQLILESASPGLKTEEERVARRTADAKLAAEIEQYGVASFVDKWENIPLFATQKNLPLGVREAIREERMSQSATGLANSLKGMGTGSQKSIWPKLKELTFPVTLITGEHDKKFCGIAAEMQSLFPNAQSVEVIEAGHAIHVEKPDEFATIVKDASNKWTS